MVGAAGFALNLRRKENEFFTVSIHELSRHIDERRLEEHELSPDELVAKHFQSNINTRKTCSQRKLLISYLLIATSTTKSSCGKMWIQTS